MNVLVLGASDKPERYAYQAMKRLREAGHQVVLVNPRLDAIEGVPCYANLAATPRPIDTVTVYIGTRRIPEHLDALLELSPRRVIFNPGTEDADIMSRLSAAGIEVVEACTLVMLRTEQFA